MPPDATPTILQQIVAAKRRAVAERCASTPRAVLEARLASAPPVRDFHTALESAAGVAIIAEIKQASPSAGVLRDDFDPVAIAQVYAAYGAAAISVLTDEPFFRGSLDHLSAVRSAVTPPILRKDFLLDAYQIIEARAAGADAVLLIAEILTDAELRQLLAEAHALGMQALVEFYEPANLPRVLDSGARLVGINNRDLRSFTTRLEHTLDLAARVGSDRLLVSESGIRSGADVARLRAAGVKAVLVGETLMRAADAGAKLAELRGG
jgi:indole-3-glycerol phosphate synthase